MLQLNMCLNVKYCVLSLLSIACLLIIVGTEADLSVNMCRHQRPLSKDAMCFFVCRATPAVKRDPGFRGLIRWISRNGETLPFLHSDITGEGYNSIGPLLWSMQKFFSPRYPRYLKNKA